MMTKGSYVRSIKVLVKFWDYAANKLLIDA
ncbi:Uncharacterised protein [Vibrio cholerae]|nr:Uncharacterised protein [Vibrio cholerae]